MSAVVCSHLDAIKFTELPVPIEGCEECLKIGSHWVHLHEHGVRQDRLVRRLTQPARFHARARGLASDHQVGGARGGLELVLRRRSRVRGRMIALDGNAIAGDLLAASSL